MAWALKDWCRLGGTNTIYIEPGSPWENPFVESFNGRARDELLNIEEFANLREARVVVEAWRMEYNTYRPHSSLGGLTPVEFKRKWLADNLAPMSVAMKKSPRVASSRSPRVAKQKSPPVAT